MKTLAIHEMYDIHRFRKDNGATYFLLLLYFPFGLLLALSRFLLCFCILGLSFFSNSRVYRRYLNHILLWGLGISVQFKNLENFQSGKNSVLVANHILMGDFFPFLKLDQHIVILCPKQANLFWKATRSFVDKIVINFGLSGLKNLRKEVAELFKKEKSTSLLIFPEGAINNGRGLHQFHKFAFSFKENVQPAYIKLDYFFPINLHPLKGTHLGHIFYSFFHPKLKYTIDFLPPQQRQAGETLEDFANRIQQLLAANFNLVPTQFGQEERAQFRQTI